MRRLRLPLLLGLVACKSDNDLHAVTQEDLFYQRGTEAVDILWIIDDSISMQDEQEQIAAGFQSFIDGLQALGEVDFQLGVVNTNMDLSYEARGRLQGSPPVITPQHDYVTLFQQRVLVGTGGSDKERGLQSALHALSDPSVSAYNAGFLREEAALAMVFVSDENDCSDDNAIPDQADGLRCYEEPDLRVPVQEYIEGYRDLKAEQRLSVSSIIGPVLAEGCEESWPGTRYETVSERLDGVIGSICDTDYAGLLGSIAERITGPMRVFSLTYTPEESTLAVYVDDEEIPSDPESGWTYQADPSPAIRFDGEWTPPFGSTIKVHYTVRGG